MRRILNARQLRTVMLMIYAVFVLIISGFGTHFAVSRYQIQKKSMETERIDIEQLIATRRILEQTLTAVNQFDFVPVEKNCDNMYRKILEFRRAANSLSAGIPIKLPDMADISDVMLRDAKNAQYASLMIMDLLKHISDPAAEIEYDIAMQMLRESLSSASDNLTRVDQFDRERILKSAYSLRTIFCELAIMLGCFFLGSVFFSIVAFCLISHNISLTLLELRSGTREIGAGNLNFRFTWITQDEPGALKRDFNKMAERLQSQASALNNSIHVLQERTNQLMEARLHKDKFLSNMSHELRTPLNSIIGFSELLEQRAESISREKIRSHSSRILHAADHLLELISSLLDVIRSDAGKLKADPTSFRLDELLIETVNFLRPLADKKSLFTQTNIPENIIVYADRRMIRQIIINLFSNAVKYTEKGYVSVSLEKNGENSVKINVSDTGIGIRQEDQHHLFTDFYRADNGPSFLAEGVGIGLALSRRLAELNHGSITFSSVYGSGSVFSLIIPISNTQLRKMDN